MRNSSSQPRRPALVTIGIPVFNGAAYLEQALESVLAQTYRHLEVIVCDNASTDATRAIAEGFARRDPRIRVHSATENQGAARNFNWALELASGDFFRWLSHDDLLEPTYVERCLETLVSAPAGTSLCFTDLDYMDEDGVKITTARRVNLHAERLTFGRLMLLPPKFCPALVFGVARTEALRRTRGIGAFIMSDLVTVAELRILGPFVRVPETLFHQRLFPKAARMKRDTHKGEAAWFSPSNSGRRYFPVARVASEYVRSIWRLAPVWRRPGLLITASLYLVGCTWRGARMLAFRSWSLASSRMASGDHRGTLGVRLWALLAGLRRRNGPLLRSVAAFPLAAPPAAATRAWARHLVRRNDPHANGILTEWLKSRWPEKRAAAIEAISEASERVDLPIWSAPSDEDQATRIGS